MKELNVPQSGKLGDKVAKRGRYGQYLSKCPTGGKRRTAARERAEGNWAVIAAVWQSLSEEEQDAWDRAGARERSRPSMRQSGRLTGWNYFFKVNNERLALGLELLREPPARARFVENPVGRLSITLEGGRIALRLEVAGTPTGPIKVYGGPPQNRGRRRYWDPRVLGVLPAAENGKSDITELYVRKYGWPAGGKRVFIWTQPLGCCAKNRMQGTNAVVPDWQAPAGGRRLRQGKKASRDVERS